MKLISTSSNSSFLDKKPCGHLQTKGYFQRSISARKAVSTGDDAKFDNTLMEDLSRQSRTPSMSIVSADTAQCYGRVNHVIISLV